MSQPSNPPRPNTGSVASVATRAAAPVWWIEPVEIEAAGNTIILAGGVTDHQGVDLAAIVATSPGWSAEALLTPSQADSFSKCLSLLLEVLDDKAEAARKRERDPRWELFDADPGEIDLADRRVRFRGQIDPCGRTAVVFEISASRWSVFVDLNPDQARELQTVLDGVREALRLDSAAVL